MLKSLYPITERLGYMLNVIIDHGGEMPAEVADDWNGWLDWVQSNEPEALQDIVNAISQCRANAAASKSEIDQWRKRMDANTRTADRLDDELLRYLTTAGKKYATIADGRKVSIVGNGGKLPVLAPETIDLNILPPGCVRTTVTNAPDKEAILKRLEAGEVIEGWRIGERGQKVKVG